MSRLPLAPPHFQPGLNSYQRLLIHRLADMFGITREVEAAPPALWNAGMINPATGQPQGVVVLVKSEASAPHPVFKILPRASASRAVSSAASSIAGEEDGSSSAGTGSGKGKGRRDLTLEEREAAYKEARERIFNQPDVERSAPAPPSAASSVAGEDTASVQSLGYGITRPSSAGSTFSRSSAALSVSGQRPPPSLASDSSAAMKPGIATFHQTPQAMYSGMRPPPSFDPTSGTWTYSQAAAPEYPYYQPHFSGPSPPASAYPYASPSPYTPPPQPMFEASPPVAPHAAWSRGLPSPALSSSSGCSLQHPFPPFHAPPAATPPAPASIASTAGSSDAGYLMRFPEGAVVTPGGSVVGPPAPYATVAGSASLRSMSSASVGSSASRVARAGSAVGASSMRRLSQSTTHSLGSVSAFSSSADAASRKSPSATGDSPETSQGGRSDAGSSTGGSESAASAGADARKRGRQTTIVGGRPGSDSAERDDGEGYEDGLTKTPSSLHPSLPAKPSWVAAAAQAERPPLAKTSSGSGPSRNGQNASPQQHILLPSPPPPPPVGAAQPKLPPYPAPLSSGIAPPPSFFGSQQPYGGPSAYPGLQQVNVPPPPPPMSPANGAPWLRSSAPVSPYGTAPSDFPPLGVTQPFYPTPPPSLPPHGYPPAWQSHAAAGPPPAHPGLAHAPTQQAFSAGSPAPAPDDLMTMPDMRRPPPRSTQLFDPNKPLAQQQGAAWFAKPDDDLRGPSASPLSLFRTFIPPSLRSKRLEMVYKAVVFDIGGVVVGSPVAAIGQAEQRWGLPPHWINVFISRFELTGSPALQAMGEQGPFQRFERSEISQDEFYRDFGRRLSDVDKGNEAYKAYCRGARIDCPPLPTNVQIDGKEDYYAQLWAMMMDPALEPDEVVVTAINRLRASRRYKVAALTNNFAPEGHTPARHRPSPPYTHPISAAELRKALRATGQEEEDAKGAGNDVLKSLFDEYVESKPDPRFFQVVLDRLGVKAEETIFLDDIPHNLAAAAKMGFKTIRVRHGRSREAVQELEKALDMDLTAPLSKL
ncbi:hypothetical protein Rhopal_000676-T1 [Rhodotorula paludigena]|uniref:SUZ domain-containing protein n=1 Tax=Rhodotorula paludigena TaxID=86838 RepID=A0AAV5G5D2_9BASI|nr:hypothetical protein Rhopal_000676-T1 [Rhodotorula paludigena]